MVFDDNLLEQYDFKRQLKQHNLEQFDLNSVSQREDRLRICWKAENQFQTLIEKTPVAIFVLQEDKIAYANSAAMPIVSYLQLQLLTNSDFCNRLNPEKHKLDNLKQNCCGEFEVEVKGDWKHWLKYWCETIEWESQPAIMVTAVDVTKYKQEEVKTQQALTVEKALSQNNIKFVSMVSHELRTPLNIISFSTSLLKRHLNQWNEAKRLRYLDRILKAVEKLGSLMDEVLIIGKAEAGKLKFNPQLLDLHLFCRELSLEIDLSHTEQPRINFVNKLKCKTILGDKNLLKLVLANLLGNAIKYSPAERPVEFIVSNDKEQIVFQIADRGIGIPTDEQSEIFEPFHRSNNVGELPGNGLGLAIAKKVVELQGGQIFLESQVNIGSTFTVKIPLKLP